MLSKLLYLHGIYYNVIGQDPNHDNLFNIINILIEKWQNNSLHMAIMLGSAILSSWFSKKLMEREEEKVEVDEIDLRFCLFHVLL